MSARHRKRIAGLAFAACLVSAHPVAVAQAAAPGDVTATAALSGVTQFDTDLDRGGQFHWSGAIASAAITRQLTPQFSAGLALRYDYQQWKFDAPAAFGGVAPWDHIDAPQVGLNFSYAHAPDLLFGVAPSVEWAYESGANTGDALTYGAVATAVKVFSPDLVVGVGVSVYRRIDETKALPFFIVNWKIDEHWRVANPFQAGPAGGAGLEVVYAPDDRWEIAGGATFRSYRFRLRENGPTRNGIGENSFIPVFGRVSRRLTADLRFDFYAAIATGGKLSVDNANGSGIYSESYRIAPAIGATLAYRF